MKRKILVIALALLTTIAGMAETKDKKDSNRPKIGLALGGGGAKGAAHIGALRVLEELGIRPDYIAGTSIGSIVGGLYACGYTADEIGNTFLSQEWISLMTDRNEESKAKVLSTDEEGTIYVFGFPVKRGKGQGARSKEQGGKEQGGKKGFGLLRGEKVMEALDSMICLRLGEDQTIKDDSDCVRRMTVDADEIMSSTRDEFAMTKIPFRCVAVDVGQQSEYVFTEGKLAVGMRASMAIPGAFKPLIYDSHTYVDGGMLNNLPVDVVRAMGADIVIAIDLTQNKHEDDQERKSLQETIGIGGLLDWVVSRPDLKKYKKNSADADVYINPNLEGYGPGSFSGEAMSVMMERGYNAATAKRKELKKAVNRKL